MNFFDCFSLHRDERPEFTFFNYNDVNVLSQQRKTRRLAKPNKSMTRIHRLMVDFLRSKKIPLPYATGGLPGTTVALHLQRHTGRRHLYALDVSNAFQCVDQERLTQVMCRVDPALRDQARRLRQTLAEYCFDPLNGGLIMGAPASNELFNTYVGLLLDEELGRLCEGYGLRFTRYIDDLLFSCPTEIGKQKRRVIRAALERAGLHVHDRKIRSFDLAKRPALLHGIRFELSGRTSLSKYQLQRFLEQIAKAESLAEIPLHLRGRMALFRQIVRVPTTRIELRVVAGYQGLLDAIDRAKYSELRADRARQLDYLRGALKRDFSAVEVEEFLTTGGITRRVDDIPVGADEEVDAAVEDVQEHIAAGGIRDFYCKRGGVPNPERDAALEALRARQANLVPPRNQPAETDEALFDLIDPPIEDVDPFFFRRDHEGFDGDDGEEVDFF